MLLGIGILVLAVHPAMHSLGTVTLIGMLIVLLMAFTIPPLLFRLYTRFSKSF
jgi:predicted RND superfamily exporter protein